MGLQHVDLSSSKDEVTEAAVHSLLQAEIVERIDEVGPVEVSVDTEHLAEDLLTDIEELNWEAAALANPVTRSSKLRERGSQGCWAGWDWGICARCVESARCVCCTGNLGSTGIVSE